MGNLNNKKKRKYKCKCHCRDEIIIKKRIEKERKEEYKITFVGENGVGTKTTLINRIMGLEFNESLDSSLECKYFAKRVDVGNNKEVTLNLLDTIGQEKYRQLTKIFLNNSDCIVLGYEVINKHTFEEIKNYWYQTIKDYLGCNLIYLVGNKIDLYERREVSKEEANEYAKSVNLRFFEISCKTKEGLNEFYNDLVNQILELYLAQFNNL